METKIIHEEASKLFPRLIDYMDNYINDGKLEEILQTCYYWKSLLDDFPWFKEFFLGKTMEENMELPYVVMSYFAWYYFSTDNKEIKEKIENKINDFIELYFDIKEMRYLLLSWFFESYAFDSKEKYNEFIYKLSNRSIVTLGNLIQALNGN